MRVWRSITRAADAAASAGIFGAIKLYKLLMSPLLGRHCRFVPTCSEYFRQAVAKHGAWRGSLRGMARLSRCHPWHPGGHDPP